MRRTFDKAEGKSRYRFTDFAETDAFLDNLKS
jgi:hypothetical protein